MIKQFHIPGLVLLAALALSCGDMYSEMAENPGVAGPAVISVAPINGEPDTLVNMEIAGTGFQAGAAATLMMTGLEIPADGEIVSGGTKISCSINLAGAALGKWSVVVTNPDGVSDELANAFEVSLTHSVTYDANGGITPPGDPNSYFSGDTVTVLGQGSLTRDGYDFADWYDSASGTVYKEDDTFIMPASDVTLTAQWTAKEYTVTFDAEGGDVPDPLSKTVTFDSPYGPLATTGRNGYTFTGWWTGAGGTGIMITGASNVSIPSDHILYAGWNVILYAITYVLNGGGDPGNPADYTIETPTITLLPPTRPGYTFDGWYADAGFTTPSSTIPLGSTGNKAFYAKWSLVDYTITYTLNGGTNAGGNPGSYTIVTPTITLLPPTRFGYTFGGWYADAGFTTPSSTIPLGSTGNKAFYAKWTANDYQVIFNSNGGSGSMSDLTITFGTSKDLTQNTFTRSGYIYIGWSTDSGGPVEYMNGASYTMDTEGVTVYAQWLTDTGMIAFDSTMNSDRDIYIIHPDGTNLKRLTDEKTGMDYAPTWSPKGQEIAYVSYPGTLYPEIMGMKNDGSNVHNITKWTDDGDQEPAWSPDGTYIAFMRTFTQNDEIHRILPAGGTAARLTTTGALIDDNNACWSPNSTKIAFDSTRDGGRHIFTMGWDGSSQTRLMPASPGADSQPSWSPDGNYIAFMRETGGNQDIYIVHVTTKVETRLTSDSGSDKHPSWSPDGSRLVFASDRDGDYEIYVMSAALGEAGGFVKLTDNTADDSSPVWSPYFD